MFVRKQDQATIAQRQAGQLNVTRVLRLSNSAWSEALTECEWEVLRLLAARYSNQVIARRLIVAVGTVK